MQRGQQATDNLATYKGVTHGAFLTYAIALFGGAGRGGQDPQGRAGRRDFTAVRSRSGYLPDRSGDHPVAHLETFTGIFQADIYAGYKALYVAGRSPGPVIEALDELDPVILMDGRKFERGLTDEGRNVTERIRTGMEGEWPGRLQEC